MDRFEMLPINHICPKCGNGNYMRLMKGQNVGRLNVKCINCNAYFRYDELTIQKQNQAIPIREKIRRGLQCIIDGSVRCEDCGYAVDKHGRYGCHQDCAMDAMALLDDRVRDYEAWSKEIGVNTCANCAHASDNRTDGKSTCPIEHNFALVKDGYCHLFIRKKEDTNES